MLLVDGHNLIGRTPGLSLEREEEAREALLRRLAALRGSGGERVVVVFDGARPGGARESRFGGVRVVFSPAGRTADDEILRRLGAANPRAVTVVTSDRGLGQRAQALGGRVESCEAFLDRLGRRRRRAGPRTPEEPVPTEEVEAWLRAFRGEHKM